MLCSFEARGSSWVWMLRPSARAVGGSIDRNRRADFAVVEKGLNLAVTSVIHRIFMVRVW